MVGDECPSTCWAVLTGSCSSLATWRAGGYSSSRSVNDCQWQLDVDALIWFPEVIYDFLRFLHSVFVKRGTDKNFFRSNSYMFLDAPFRQEQSKSLVRLDFLLEEQDCTSSRLTHRSPLGCPAAYLQKDEARPPYTCAHSKAVVVCSDSEKLPISRSVASAHVPTS